MEPGTPGPRLPVWLQTLCYGLRPVGYLEWCHRRYGDSFTVRLPADATMRVVSDPAAIKDVMALTADDFTTATGATFIEPFLGNQSLLLLDGDRHKRERKLLMKGLHAGSMSEYAETMAAATLADIATWPRQQPFGLHQHMQSITLDVIVRLIIGADDDQGHDELIALLRPWLQQGAGSVLFLWPPMRRGFLGRGPWPEFVRNRQAIFDWLDAHIARRRHDPDLAERTDVLSLLLLDGGLDDVALRDQFMTMLAAGHDTSATALAWAFCLLLRHPGVLRRLVAEIDAGEEDRYLDAVVKEVLRLTPVVLEAGRTTTRELVVGGQSIPAGVSVIPSILLAQRRPDRYPEPLDFRPERFLDQPVDPLTWLPFGGGIRRCIGAAFATLEIKTVLRTVLANIGFEPVGQMEKPRRRAVTMIPSRGARAVVTGTRQVSRVGTAAPTVNDSHVTSVSL